VNYFEAYTPKAKMWGRVIFQLFTAYIMHQGIDIDDIDKYTGAVPKVKYPVFLGWVTTSEPDVGGMAVKVESCQQYSVQCCSCVILLISVIIS